MRFTSGEDMIMRIWSNALYIIFILPLEHKRELYDLTLLYKQPY
jgi:hypothetical protein